jgi:hypothetical protein
MYGTLATIFNPNSTFKTENSGLYHKHFTIVIDDSSIVIKFEASLTDDARVVIYDCHMFIVDATGKKLRQCLMMSIIQSCFNLLSDVDDLWY